jgi:formate dehydrogenase subunit gamma
MRGPNRTLKKTLGLAVAALLLTSLAAQAQPQPAQPAPNPVTGAQTTLPEPTRGLTNNAEMWRGVRQGVQGTVSIPNRQAGILIQSEGETWRNWRNGPISTYGTWIMLGMIALLALFFAARGRIRIENGWAGRTIERFNGLERAVHWLTATCFVLLAITGLNILYGRYVLLPLLGPGAFSTITLWGKIAHNFLSFGFMLGIVLMLVMWVGHNLPTRADLKWLAMGGGLFGRGRHPPAWKFNAGQKLLFWAVIGFGALISVSGVLLLFPFYFVGMLEMQLAQMAHAVVAVLFIAVILGHIYIGTIGMEGAFSAMGSGRVDENWAREHHDLWVAQLRHGRPSDQGPARTPDAAPAE